MKAIPCSHFLSDWAFFYNLIHAQEDYLFQREREWRRIEEENREGGVALGGQDNVIVHPVPQDIFTQTAQGTKVKQDQKPSKGENEGGSAIKGRLSS